MTIEEKYKSAVDLLTNLYLTGHKESVEVGSNILQENGLGGRDFWEVICPRLKSEGFLKDYYDPSFFPEFLYKSRAEEVQNKLWRLESFKKEERVGSGIFNPLFVQDKWSIKVLNEYEELKGQELQLKKELEAIPKICRFLVNGDKIAQRNIDYTDTASRKAWERKWNILQSIWTVYKSNGNPKEITIPITELRVVEKTKSGADGILDGLKESGCFSNWVKDNKNYRLQEIAEQTLTRCYKETGEIYRRFAETFEATRRKDAENHQKRQEKIDDMQQAEYNYEILSLANKKRLRILEKLKEEWDVYPNKNRYTISQKKYWGWIREVGIDDFPQFENFLLALKKEGLIDKFNFIPDYV